MWNRDWTEPCGCRWDPSLGRHLSAKQGFCFHYADVYLPGNGQALQTKIIRHRPLRAVTPSGLRLPAESVTGMVSGARACCSSGISIPRPVPSSRQQLQTLGEIWLTSAAGFIWEPVEGCVSSPGHLSWARLCLGGSGIMEYICLDT